MSYVLDASAGVELLDDPPAEVTPPTIENLRRRAVLGGLIHEYDLRGMTA
ncbi:MAG: hypothetical protein QOC92_2281 [Acidimicrobiaceae bacterium]